MTDRDRSRWIILAGPTAAGKSRVGLSLAEAFGGEIVNADSRQVYRHLDIGTAKPTSADRDRVPHHLFDVVDPDEPFDVARYASMARSAVRRIAERGSVPILVGGTGLYVRTAHRGLFRGPARHAALRQWLERADEAKLGLLHRWLGRLDPASVTRIHRNDRVRLVRAVEVVLLTGRPISELQRSHAFSERLGSPLYLVVCPPREVLDRAIETRVVEMFDQGLVSEVESLRDRGWSTALRPLRSLGYAQAARLLDGEIDRTEAVAETIRVTRRFARRQETWFRAESEAIWVDSRDGDGIRRRVERFLS